MYRYIIFIPWC